MTGFAGRLARRAMGGPSALAVPAADPRFGVRSPSAPVDGEPGDPFAGAPVLLDAPPTADPPTREAARPEAPARTIVERWRERSPATAQARPALVPAHRSPTSQPDVVFVTNTSSTEHANEVTTIAASASTRLMPAAAMRGEPRAEPAAVTITTEVPRTALPRPIDRADDRPRHTPEAGSATGETVIRELRPEHRPAPPAERTLPASFAERTLDTPPQPARLEPRARAQQASVEPESESSAPRVVIGNLHIEVVRAPAPPAPRREPARRDVSRAAAPTAAPSTRRRRKPVFGLGQL